MKQTNYDTESLGVIYYIYFRDGKKFVTPSRNYAFNSTDNSKVMKYQNDMSDPANPKPILLANIEIEE